MDRFYYIVHSFMSRELGLKGLAKEVFAIIFGFWISSGKREAWVSLSTMQLFTGGTRPAIIKAVQLLEGMGYIQALRNPGKRSLYIVTIDPKIIQDYEASFVNRLVKPQYQAPVKIPNHFQETKYTSSGKENYLVNKIKVKGNNSLTVKNKNEIDSGGLPEA